jgi:hypothetical protein
MTLFTPVGQTGQSTYYVATKFRYVLVDARDEDEARELGAAKLYELYEDLRRKLGHEVEIKIHILREASDKEIGIWNDHVEFVTRELERRNNQ